MNHKSLFQRSNNKRIPFKDNFYSPTLRSLKYRIKGLGKRKLNITNVHYTRKYKISDKKYIFPLSNPNYFVRIDKNHDKSFYILEDKNKNKKGLYRLNISKSLLCRGENNK